MNKYNVKMYCNYGTCKREAIYGINGRERCLAHKTDNMICILKKYVCLYNDCITRPYYNLPGKPAKYCAKHKTSDMVNRYAKTCEYPSCDISNPSFDLPGGKGRYCSTHKSSDMIDVAYNKCKFHDCNIRPIFGIIGGKPQYCVTHKSLEMVDVVSKKCEDNDCTTKPHFDLPGGKGRFCVKHKTPEMIDVISKLCTYPQCFKHALFGKPGSPTTHCGKHRQPGMIKRPNGKCIHCTSPAIYGSNYIAKHCEVHKEDTEQNLVERNCKSCNLVMILDNDNYCEYCNPITFKTARLAKQNALMDFLDSNGLPGSSTDTIIDGGVCGKERPDRVFDFGDKILILECDEHQHRDRLLECENTRMINVSQSFGGLPVYFIRFNPDDYSPLDDSIDIHPITVRYQKLLQLITSIRDCKIILPHALLSVLYMYYDDYNYTSSWEIICVFETSIKS